MVDATRYRLFARQFLLLLDGSKAAVAAGYSPNAAPQMAHKLLKRPAVQREIEKLRGRQERRLERKLDHVLDELDMLAFARMSDYAPLLAADDPVEHLATMDPEEAAAIEGLTIDEHTDAKGEKHRRIKIKLHDKRAALMDLGRHRGMRLGRFQVEAVPPMPRPDLSMLDAEDREVLRKIAEKMEARQRAPQIEGDANEPDGADDRDLCS
jgi:phage terminase small subunit